MGQKVFIPVTDELIFDRPELISAPLRPYSENLACYHWLDVRLNPEDELNSQSVHTLSDRKTRQTPGFQRACAA